MALDVYIGQTIVIRRADLAREHPSLEQQLIQRLTFPNPAYNPRRKQTPPVPQKLYEYDFVGDQKEWLRLQRGAITTVTRVLQLYNRTANFITGTVVTRASAPPRSPAAVDSGLRDYQLDAAKALIDGVQGLISIPTGGGKTRTVSAAILAVMEPSVVLCHTADIFDQWVERFREMGVTAREVRGAGSDFRPLAAGEIAVAMVQTVSRDLTRSLRLLGSAGCVVFDEVHHLPAGSWRSIAQVTPARFRWGCTATEEREDGLDILLELLVGRVVFKVTAKELIRRGFLQAPTIIPVESGWLPLVDHYFAWVECSCGAKQRTTPREIAAGSVGCKAKGCKAPVAPDAAFEVGRLNYALAQQEAVHDPDVIAKACGLAERGVDLGRTVLMLLPRTDAVDLYVEVLRQRGVPAVGVTGGTAKGSRRRLIQGVRDRTYPVLVATSLADEGLDIRALDMAVSVMSGKAQGKAKQRMGRIIRLGGKDPLLFEIVHGSEYLVQWEKRRAVYTDTFGLRSVLRATPIDLSTAIIELDRRSRDTTLEKAVGF